MTSTPEVLVLATKKGVNLIFFSKNKYFDFFSLSLITIYLNRPKNIINTIKEVLVSIKPKFSEKFFNFYEKNSNFTIFRKVQIILKITKKTGIVSHYTLKNSQFYMVLR